MAQPTPRDPDRGINPARNPETNAAERDQSSYMAQGGNSSGTLKTGPAPGDEPAVSGDTGPERPGRQG